MGASVMLALAHLFDSADAQSFVAFVHLLDQNESQRGHADTDDDVREHERLRNRVDDVRHTPEKDRHLISGQGTQIHEEHDQGGVEDVQGDDFFDEIVLLENSRDPEQEKDEDKMAFHGKPSSMM